MKRRIARLLVCGLLVQSLLGNAAVTRAEELPVTEAAEEQELTTNTPHQTEEETEDSGEKPEEEQPETEQNQKEDTETVPEEKEETEADPEQETEENSEPTPEQTPARDVKGSLQVQLSSALGGPDHQSYTAVLKGSSGSESKMELSEMETAVTFSDLEDGDYELLVSGKGFETYSQKLQIGKKAYSVQLYTDFIGGFDFSEGKRHPGVLLYGDVNGDQKLDEKDQNQIIAAVEDQTAEGDLNGDGSTTLVDLQYFAAHYKTGLDTKASVQSSIPGAMSDTSAEGTQIVGGEEQLDKLFQAEGSVQLKPEKGGAITESNPVALSFDFALAGDPVMEGVVIHAPQSGNGAIENGKVQITYLDENGQEKQMEVSVGASARTSGASVNREPDGTLVIDFGKQIAVKKVVLVVTGTKNQGNLAEISQVEFLNDMESRIPAPEMDIPENLAARAGNKEFTLSWDPVRNVTGYEVSISSEGREELRKTADNTMDVKLFLNEKLENKQEYVVRVQSVNGQWKSGFGEAITVIPRTDEKPAPPDNLKVTGMYQGIRASWKQMKDTDSYNLYYREEGEEAYQKIEGIKSNQYQLEGLKEDTVYYVYVTGVNELGEGAPSLESYAQTASLKAAKMPGYKLLNTDAGEGKLSSHIESAVRGRGTMVDSPLDEAGEKTALGVFDKSYRSYYFMEDWDDGVAYPGEGKGITVTLDDFYKMDTFTFAESEDLGTGFNAASVFYWDEKSQKMEQASCTLQQKTSENGRKYYLIRLADPVRTNKLRFGFGRGGNVRNIRIAELNLYLYDSLADDIEALYADDLYTTLRADVTEKTLEELQNRLDTPDEVSQEYHPDREQLQRELDTAKAIFREEALQEAVKVHTSITASADGHLNGVGGLNDWQPLGISAYEGEELTVYVGAPGKKAGDNTDLTLVATQYHGEAASWSREIGRLKVGKNEITVPGGMQSINVEHGGALYVRYTGRKDAAEYGIRVSGGTRIPVLDLYQTTEEERQERLLSYVEALEKQAADLKNDHETHRKESRVVDYDFDQANCILGTTDILMKEMMYSVPGGQILSALGSGSTAEKAEKLDQSLKAMEQLMHLFYQHKGLSDAADAGGKDRLPARHLNIRYMRMFAGAFMYASGNHIGIEWGSVPALASSVPVVSENGKYKSGNLFGWGIAHEIGHQLNQGQYAVAEITNNYFSLLAQAKDTADSVRFDYQDVYEKVTSQTTGYSDNVFVQLAMYWQLHLAYDRGYNYKTYDTWKEQFQNLFFARVDAYARDASRAPAPEGIALSLESKNADQNLMRLASAAAGKDLTEFFTRWGLTPDAATAAYMQQFPEEERAIYYVNDDARSYEIENGTKGTIKGKDVISPKSSVSVSDQVPNQVTLNLKTTAADPNVILGYEITRCTMEQGQIQREVVGFATEETYVDTVSTINNRVVAYEVAAVDQFLQRSAVQKIGEVKISGDGSLGKEKMTLTSNLVSDQDESRPGEEGNPCEPQSAPAYEQIIDGDYSAVYTGSSEKADPELTFSFQRSFEVCGLKYTVADGAAPIEAYEIQVRSGGEWKTVKSGSFQMENGSQTVYFENENQDPWVATYDAEAVRLVAKGQAGKKISVSEIDILGPSGDNIEFYEDGTPAIGILKEDFVYDQNTGDAIPKGSLIFTGTYKGNPAYNVVMLYDEEGNLVGGSDSQGALKAQQIILAEVPEHGELGETSDGSWIYYLEPGSFTELPGQVRAELYRVDNAMTNEGQRLVSDTMLKKLPEKLPEISLK